MSKKTVLSAAGAAVLIAVVAVAAWQLRSMANRAAAKPLPPNPDEKALKTPGRGVVVSATLTRGEFNVATFRSPQWNVALTIENYTDQAVELGESLAVIEKVRESASYAGSYVAREGAASSFHMQRLKLRYGFDWGYQIGKDGMYDMTFCGSGMCTYFFPRHMDTFEGLGYGRVNPHCERKIEVEVPFPVGAQENRREYVLVIPPSVRFIGSQAADLPRTILKYNASAPKGEEHFQPVETISFPMRALDLRATVNNASAEVWKRVLALNWLVETFPKESAATLIECLKNGDAPGILRAVAALNLGALKLPAAAGPLMEVTRTTTDLDVRRWSIDALGDIGDKTAAPVVRPYLTNAEDGVALAAMESAGKLKDTEAVVTLLAVLVDPKKKQLHDGAGSGLAAIGNRQAVDGLLDVLKNPKSEARAVAADKLGAAGDAGAVPALAAVSADQKAADDVRTPALKSLGKLGGAEALTALRAAANGKTESVRNAAIQALGEIKDRGGVETLIELAAKPGYAGRKSSISTLAKQKKSEALPVLRTVVADKQAPTDVRQEACNALKDMKDTGGVDALAAVLDDSNEAVYSSALTAFGAIDPKRADQAALAALKSKHSAVRHTAAIGLGERKTRGAVRDIWEAYTKETEDGPATGMAWALIDLKFADPNAAGFLAARLSPRTNKLWFQDVRLLKHLSGKDFGPPHEYVDDKARDAALAKWREWAKTKPASQGVIH